jgi:hypothetical protein
MKIIQMRGSCFRIRSSPGLRWLVRVAANRAAVGLRMFKVEAWYKSVVIAAGMELVLILMLANIAPTSGYLLHQILVWYHIIPLSVATFLWLLLLGHGHPEPGASWIWGGSYWVLVFFGQVAITTPCVQYLRCRWNSNRNKPHTRLSEE